MTQHDQGGTPTADTDNEWKARLAIDLSKMAFARLQNRQKIEWQVALSLWTFFVLATYAALEFVKLGPRATLGLGVVSAVGFLIIDCIFIYFRMHLEKRNRRDQTTAYYWETCAEFLAGFKKRPEGCSPPAELRYDYRDNGSGQATLTEPPFPRYRWAPLAQILITIALSALAPLMLLFKAFSALVQ